MSLKAYTIKHVPQGNNLQLRYNRPVEYNKNITPLQEIELLRKRVEELESVNPALERKETILEAVKKHAEETPVTAQTSAISSTDNQETDADEVDIIVDEHGPDMRKFLSLVEEKGIWYALDLAKKTSPHLLDDFHSAVVQYLQAGHGF